MSFPYKIPEEVLRHLATYHDFENLLASRILLITKESYDNQAAFMRVKAHEAIVRIPNFYDHVLEPLYILFANAEQRHEARHIIGFYFPELMDNNGLDQALAEVMLLDGKIQEDEALYKRALTKLSGLDFYKERDLPPIFAKFDRDQLDENIEIILK